MTFTHELKRPLMRIATGLALGAALLLPMAHAADEPTLNQVYATAQAGKLEQAQVMMQQVLVAHPNSGKAHFVQAELFARQGDLARSRDALATAERLAPGLAFAKPEAVQALRAQLNATPGATARPMATGATHNAAAPASSGGLPWGMILLVGGGVVALVIYLAGRQNRNAIPAPGYNAGLGGPQTFGNGAAPGPYGPQGGPGYNPAYGPGYGPGYGQAPAPGMGSRIAGGLATGLAVGAGVMAAEAIARNLSGGHETHGSDGYNANNDFQPVRNADMGGQDFGVNDGGSWDDGGGAGGGGDWDN